MAGDASGELFTGMSRLYNANNPNFFGGGTTDAPVETYARHLGGSNLLFADGHVKFMNQGSMFLDPARASLPAPYNDDAYRFKVPVRPDDDRVK